MVNRRSVLGSITAFAMVPLAGCQEELEELVPDMTDLDADAEPARIAESALESYDYVEVDERKHRIEDEFEIGGETQEVKAGNWITSYLPSEIGDDIDDLEEFPEELEESGGMLGLLSTPDLTVAGQTVNPIEYFDDEEIITAVDDEVDSMAISNVEQVDETEITILSSDVDVGIFTATLEREDETIEGYVYLGKVEHEDDMIVPVGAHTEAADAKDELLGLIEAIEHPA